MQMTIRNLFAILLFLALFAMALRPIADADFWWHLRTGQLIFETHSIPHSDPFSYTNTGKTWIAHEWLSEIIIYSFYRLGGYGLLILVFAMLITTTFYLVYLLSKGHPYIAGFTLLLGAFASAPTWGVRPQMITYLFFALFLLFLYRYYASCKIKYLISLPLFMFLWVNLHGAYALGIGLVGIYLAGAIYDWLKGGEISSQHTPRYSRKSNEDKHILYVIHDWYSEFYFRAPQLSKVILLCSILGLCILATFANPNSLRLLSYPFETLSNQAMQQYIQEWFSPDFHQPEWQPLAWLILALLGAGLLGRKSIPSLNILLLLIFGYMALRSVRHVPLFVITAVPILSEAISPVVQNKPIVQKIGRALQWFNVTLIGLTVLTIGLRYFSIVQEQRTTEKEYFPVAAVDWIARHHPTGNIFNSYGWGGYIIWRLYPEYRVFIDGRADIYGDAFIADYLRIENGEPGWESSLGNENIRIVLIERSSPLAREIYNSSSWQVILSDEKSILFLSR